MTNVLKAMPLAVLAAAVVTVPAGAPAAAQTVCGERAAIVAELGRRYGETRRSIGVQQGRRVVEVYASDRTGTWTILVTNTDGRTCLMAAGDAFETEAVARADRPA